MTRLDPFSAYFYQKGFHYQFNGGIFGKTNGNELFVDVSVFPQKYFLGIVILRKKVEKELKS